MLNSDIYMCVTHPSLAKTPLMMNAFEDSLTELICLSIYDFDSLLTGVARLHLQICLLAAFRVDFLQHALRGPAAS